MFSFVHSIFHIEKSAKIRHQISSENISILLYLLEMLGHDPSVRNSLLPFDLKDGWSKAHHTGRAVVGFKLKSPKVKPCQKVLHVGHKVFSELRVGSVPGRYKRFILVHAQEFMFKARNMMEITRKLMVGFLNKKIRKKILKNCKKQISNCRIWMLLNYLMYLRCFVENRD